MKKGKMHISHIEGVAAFVSMINKAIPVKSVCWRPGRCNLRSRGGYLQSASSHESMGYWTDGSEMLSRSLTEVSAQSGWTVVHSELDEGVQEVSLQIGELLTWADLL